ncbi:MAG TPA: glycosyl hydrolase family 28-related protein [Streptosporangiaceae bacterium]
MQEPTRRAALGGLGGIGLASAALFGAAVTGGAARAATTATGATAGAARAGLNPAALNPALDSATLDPATLDPAALDPAALDPGGLDSANALSPAPALDPAAAAAYGVDVRRQGATGDGITDDSAAFSAAFAKASNASADGGNLVIVPPGTYRIATPLTAQAPIHLEGLAGEAGSVLKFDPGIANGLTIAPTAETYPGPAIEIHGLYFEYSGPGAALLIDESAVRSVFHDTRVTGCRFHVGGNATGYASINQRSIIVAHNQFLGSGKSSGTGISVSDSDNTMITDNVFYDIEYCVHGIRGATRVFNAGCMVLGNSMSGCQKCLFFENWEAIQAVGNMLDGALANSVHLADCYNSMLTANYLGQSGTGPALLIETSSPRGGLGQMSFSGNFINYYAGTSGTAAITLNGVSAAQPVDQVTISGNTINHYPAVGILLRNAQNVLITGNTLTRASATADGVQAVYDQTPGANHITGNIVDAAITARRDTVSGNFGRVPVPS